jgi:hypothetical protein
LKIARQGRGSAQCDRSRSHIMSFHPPPEGIDAACALTAGLLARGSVLLPAFPKQMLQWHTGQNSPLTVAGAATELDLSARTAFPFGPTRGPSTLRA